MFFTDYYRFFTRPFIAAMYDIREFEDIRPYYDSEVREAILRIISHPLFQKIADYLFPDTEPSDLSDGMRTFTSVYEFQSQIMHKAIRAIISKSSDGLSYEGFGRLDRSEAYLFVANHRDIVLDSGILEILLHENGFETSEITFGSNLMKDPFVVDVGKLNKMFKVHRGETGREFLQHSQRLSAYIRYTITQKKQSVWIAQRSGRTKNGDDRTETGILKMFAKSGQKDFAGNLSGLKITPLTISYEYEPCDNLKVREQILSARGPYYKAPDEDLKSILAGISEYKGRIRFVVGEPVIHELETIARAGSDNERYKMLAQVIDRQIHRNFKLWPANYAAFDLLYDTRKYVTMYSTDEKERFIAHIENRIESLKGLAEKTDLLRMFLDLYARPVINREEIKS